MTEQQFKKLRAYYHSLTEQKNILDESAQINAYFIQQETVVSVANEIESIERDFPGLVPAFDRNFAGGKRLEMVRIYLATAIGRLRAETEQAATSSPVTQTREFPFIVDSDLRAVLERDYDEIQRAFVSRCYKSVIILSGGAIEAILLDLLLKNPGSAHQSPEAPKQPDLTRWDLKDLINVAVDCNLVSAGVQKLSDPVREFRNLIHPGNEIRNKLKFDAEEARIALEVLNIVHRELS
jgi:hypothetical protein